MKILDLVTRLPKHHVTTDGKNAVLCCFLPGCRDTKGHMYLHLGSGLFQCYKCSGKGAFRKFLHAYNDAFGTDYHPDQFDRQLMDRLLARLPKVEPDVPVGALPEGYRPVWLDGYLADVARRYLTSRNVTPDEWRVYEIGYAFSGPCAHRVIFPIRESGKVINWAARAWTPDREPKMLMDANSGKDCLFNFDRALAFDECVVVEGPFDSIRTGYNAVALLGKSASPGQMRKLVQGNWKRIYFCLDADTRLTERLALAKRMATYTETYILNLPTGDPGSLPVGAMQRLLPTAERVYF